MKRRVLLAVTAGLLSVAASFGLSASASTEAPSVAIGAGTEQSHAHYLAYIQSLHDRNDESTPYVDLIPFEAGETREIRFHDGRHYAIKLSPYNHGLPIVDEIDGELREYVTIEAFRPAEKGVGWESFSYSHQDIGGVLRLGRSMKIRVVKGDLQ